VLTEIYSTDLKEIGRALISSAVSDSLRSGYSLYLSCFPAARMAISARLLDRMTMTVSEGLT
jgi:hypothetical protein